MFFVEMRHTRILPRAKWVKAKISNYKDKKSFIPHEYKFIWLNKYMPEVLLNELFLTRPCHDLLSKTPGLMVMGTLAILEQEFRRKTFKWDCIFPKTHGVRLS